MFTPNTDFQNNEVIVHRPKPCHFLKFYFSLTTHIQKMHSHATPPPPPPSKRSLPTSQTTSTNSAFFSHLELAGRGAQRARSPWGRRPKLNYRRDHATKARGLRVAARATYRRRGGCPDTHKTIHATLASAAPLPMPQRLQPRPLQPYPSEPTAGLASSTSSSCRRTPRPRPPSPPTHGTLPSSQSTAAPLCHTWSTPAPLHRRLCSQRSRP